MEHISDIEILELVAGRLPDDRRRLVEQHIRVCADCARKVEQAEKTWGFLGEWDLETTGVDISEAVVERARQDGAVSNFRFLSVPSSRRLISVVLKVAASIIIAVSVGVMSGVYSAQKTLAIDSPVVQTPDYLAALGLQWSSDLNWSVLEEHSIDAEVDE